MYRLLIVDDEHHIVDWLYELFTEKSGLDLDIAKAYSGNDALNILNDSKVDILLSDIRMPGMSGLELQQKVNEYWPDCKIIFLTGFDEFDYIYQAMKNESVCYLLKTEDDDRILEAVRKAAASIDKGLKNEELLRRSFDSERLVAYLAKREAIRGILASRLMEGGLLSGVLGGLGVLLDTGRPMMMLLGVPAGTALPVQFYKRITLMLSIEDLTAQYLRRGICGVTADMDEYHILWLLQGSKEEDSEEAWRAMADYVGQMLETFQAACNSSLGVNLTLFLYSEPVPLSAFGERYDSIKLAVSDVCVCQDTEYPVIRTIGPDELAAEGSLPATEYPWAQKTGQLQDCLEQGLPEDFCKLLDDMAKGMGGVQPRRHLPSAERYYSLSLVFIRHINRYDLSGKLSESLPLNRLADIESFGSSKDAFAFYKSIGMAIFEWMRSQSVDREKEVADRIKSFVAGNLCAELTLASISKHVNYNPSYVSRLFKKATGMNLFDYINAIRIGRAKELIESTSKVY